MNILMYLLRPLTPCKITDEERQICRVELRQKQITAGHLETLGDTGNSHSLLWLLLLLVTVAPL